jgi:hypothetical protein
MLFFGMVEEGPGRMPFLGDLSILHEDEASRLRALAAKARRLARSLSTPEDRERLFDMAQEHDAKAQALESGPASRRRPPSRAADGGEDRAGRD